MTASHVIANVKDTITCIFANDTEWFGFNIINFEHHHSQDVSLIKIEGNDWKSPFVIECNKEFGLKEYILCGYPESTLFENELSKDKFGRILPRPDMISTKGHIKRRIMREINIANVKGNSFYELSNLAGWGCSGGPLNNNMPDRSCRVLGIYVAQDIFYVENKNDPQIKYIDYGVGYALTSDCIYDWKPILLSGKSIFEESLNFVP